MALGWQSVTAKVAVRAAVVLATQATSFAAPVGSGSVKQFGWYQQLSKAAPVAVAQQGYSVVPFNTPQTNTVTIAKWQQPLSIAVPVAKAQSGLAFVPFNTQQTNTVTIDKWQQPLSIAVAVTKAQVGVAFVPFSVPQTSSAPPFLQQQGPSAAPVAQARPSQATAFATPAPASNSVTQFGWYAPLSSPVAVAKAQLGNSFVPFNTVQVNPASPFLWQQVSVAAQVAKAQQGFSVVPLNTAQTVPALPPNGWFGQINPPAKSVAAQPSQATAFAVPPQAAGAVTPGQFGWYAPLSKAVPVAQAQQGHAFVPFNTAQIPPIYIPLPFDASYPRTAVVYYQSLFSPLPPMAAPSNTVAQVTWQQPLSVAVKLAQAAPRGITLVPFNTVQPSNSISTFGWFSPLSKPAPVALPSAGNTFVPFNTPQLVPPPVIIPPPFHGWTPATKNIETWSTISNVNGLWIPAIKNIEGWTNE